MTDALVLFAIKICAVRGRESVFFTSQLQQRAVKFPSTHFASTCVRIILKLFHQLLVAPAALGLLAPVAANATELNINGVSDYAATGEQVTSITQFSDVYPTDWAYQALSNLIERYGCTEEALSNFMEGLEIQSFFFFFYQYVFFLT